MQEWLCDRVLTNQAQALKNLAEHERKRESVRVKKSIFGKQPCGHHTDQSAELFMFYKAPLLAQVVCEFWIVIHSHAFFAVNWTWQAKFEVSQRLKFKPQNITCQILCNLPTCYPMVFHRDQYSVLFSLYTKSLSKLITSHDFFYHSYARDSQFSLFHTPLFQ